MIALCGALRGCMSMSGFRPEKIELWPLARLQPYAGNAKTHPPEQVTKIAASIANFGWTTPCFVSEDGELIAGHGRVLAADQLGLTEVPVIVLGHLSEAERRAYRLADNKTAESPWAEMLVAQELKALMAEDLDVSLTGFDDDDIQRMLRGPDMSEPDSSAKEINPDDYKMGCTCPKCGFEFDPKT